MDILLSGMVAGVPHHGGASWAVLQYLLGLRELGHQVVLVEPVQNDVRFSPRRAFSRSKSASYFRSLFPLLDGERAALLLTDSEETVGLPYARLRQFARSADLLINVSGMLGDDRLIDEIPVRAFLDLDPGFNQVWHESGYDMSFDLHTHFVSVGQAIGRADCPVPTCGRCWIPTLPPVVLERWPAAGRPSRDAFTTVGNWRSYGPVEHAGIRYGQRAHSLRELISLPRRTPARFQVALAIHPEESSDLLALRENGWELLDPVREAGTPDRYARFIRASKAELGIAKSGYVASRGGWFSDRSACYLASGRPVVAQETGFSEFLPTGRGLFAFRSEDEAAAVVEEVVDDWERQSRAARLLAEEHLDSRKVLRQLVEELGAIR
jgi:hypothetical protein